MLPIRQLPRDEFTFDDGTKLPIRGLSRAEAIQIQTHRHDPAALEILCISAATGATQEETTTWYATAPNKDVERLFDAIIVLSGLDTETGKADAENSHSANGTESTTSSPKTSV